MSSQNILAEEFMAEKFNSAIVDIDVISEGSENTLKRLAILYDSVYIICDEDISSREYSQLLYRMKSEDVFEIISRNNSDHSPPEDFVDGDKFFRQFDRIKNELMDSNIGTQYPGSNWERSLPKIAELISLSIQLKGTIFYEGSYEDVMSEVLVNRREDFQNDYRLDALDSIDSSLGLDSMDSEKILNLRNNSLQLISLLENVDDPTEVINKKTEVLEKRRNLDILSQVLVVSLFSISGVSIAGLPGGMFGLLLGALLRKILPQALFKIFIEIRSFSEPWLKIFQN